MKPSRVPSPRVAAFAALSLAVASGCAAISGLDALEVGDAGAVNDATVDLPEGSVVLPDGAVVLADGAVVQPDGGVITDGATGRDTATDGAHPHDAPADTQTKPDSSPPEAGVDAGDPTFKCGTDRCAGNDVCCTGATLNCGGLPCAGGTYVACVDVATCATRGGGVCCMFGGSHTGCAASCTGATVCVVDSDCPGNTKCTGSDSTLGKTVGICQ